MPTIGGLLRSSEAVAGGDGLFLRELSVLRTRYKRNILISFAVLLAAAALAYHPRVVDLPLARLVNSFVNRSPALDTLFYGFDNFFTFSGVVLMALLWSCWFKNTNLEVRASILAGSLSSIVAGGVSRLLQHQMATHPRPFYDRALGFHPPSTLPKTPFNTWNSFPSDHAAVFFGLAVVIYVVAPRLGLIAAAWLTIVEISRIYMGAHYPSDLMAGAALAATLVWASQSARSISAARYVLRWERSSPGLFYSCAFLISYQIATLFADVRDVAGMIVHG